MKLQSQLNAAFTALLLVILTVTGFVIYSLILDMLIDDERAELRQKGELLVQVINEQYSPQNAQGLSSFLKEQDLQLFLYDNKRNRILASTMSVRIVNGVEEMNSLSGGNEELVELGDRKFVSSTIPINPASAGLELILLTPLNDLQQVQQDFFQRLLLVFIVGALAAIALSYFLTNKLVTPLSRLKIQLKKVEKRQFDQLERVKATGEIKEVEQSVYEMAGELQRYVSSQQAFFQNASHELKTPLMTIQGYAEGIRDGVFDEGEKEKGLEMMVTEVSRLKAIINEMIVLAKLDTEPAAYEPEYVKADELISQVSDRALPLVNEKGLELIREVDSESTLFVDQEKVLRALLNITFNGIRHAKTKVAITVTGPVITIEDDGPGISEELMPHIFHRFVKGKNGETGLGLAIARAIVEQSGGKITAGESAFGGAKFTLSFKS